MAIACLGSLCDVIWLWKGLGKSRVEFVWKKLQLFLTPLCVWVSPSLSREREKEEEREPRPLTILIYDSNGTWRNSESPKNNFSKKDLKNYFYPCRKFLLSLFFFNIKLVLQGQHAFPNYCKSQFRAETSCTNTISFLSLLPLTSRTKRLDRFLPENRDSFGVPEAVWALQLGIVLFYINYFFFFLQITGLQILENPEICPNDSHKSHLEESGITTCALYWILSTGCVKILVGLPKVVEICRFWNAFNFFLCVVDWLQFRNKFSIWGRNTLFN